MQSLSRYSLRLILFTVLSTVFFTGNILSQKAKPTCGYKIAMDQMEKKYPGYKKAEQKQFDFIRTVPEDHNRGEVYRIPVVFHVIYHSDKQNIADQYIHSQLDILNKAFRHNHSEVGDLRPEFKALAGDAEIEFYLATKDPDGNPTGGITRTYTDIEFFGDFTVIIGGFDPVSFERIKYTDQGGYDGWPSNRYLNIWIADEGFDFLGVYIPAILGLATPPVYPSLPENWPEGAVDGIKDGVFLQYQTIGLNNPYQEDLGGFVSQGRTAVHEIGHYLGLRHIDGDEECGTDGIDDTPVMDLSTQSEECPLTSVNTCEDGLPNDLPDMWENYMDYSNDICQRLFTEGQVEHMRKVLSTQRDTLINGTLKKNTSTVGLLDIYPNPTTDKIYLKNIPPNGVLYIYDRFGNTLYYNDNFKDDHVDVSSFISGVYMVRYTMPNKMLRNLVTVIK